MAIVMLVLASRANRLQRESDARVETLEAMATGSVLFASDRRLRSSWPLPDEDDADLALNEFADEDDWPDRRPANSHRAELLRRSGDSAAYPFVMTVPAAAGAGRVQVSFDRARSRSRP